MKTFECNECSRNCKVEFDPQCSEDNPGICLGSSVLICKWHECNNTDVSSQTSNALRLPPDWAAVESVVYHKQYGYMRVLALHGPVVHAAEIVTGDSHYLMADDFFNGAIVEAQERPFNSQEMEDLVGKKIKKGKFTALVTAYTDDYGILVFEGCRLTAGQLWSLGYTLDGMPCCKFEHLIGEELWVE